MSRTVNSEWLFAEPDREKLRKLIWKVAEFCGVEVVTYAILSNHFHVLVNVPKRTEVAAQEVLRRYLVLYPAPTRFRPNSIEEIRQEVEAESPKGLRWLEKQRRQMGDVSHYMKLLKQRFTVWFNFKHRRHGTLWSERFKSVLVEDGCALATMAAYVDLNPVRAGLVEDPKDYRYCGYAEAVAGNPRAQNGCIAATHAATWAEASTEYRLRLFGDACRPRARGDVLKVGALESVIRARGRISQSESLLCRLRYFTDGAVLGSHSFVREYLTQERQKYGRVIALEPKALPSITDWGPLTVMRRPRAVTPV